MPGKDDPMDDQPVTDQEVMSDIDVSDLPTAINAVAESDKQDVSDILMAEVEVSGVQIAEKESSQQQVFNFDELPEEMKIAILNRLSIEAKGRLMTFSDCHRLLKQQIQPVADLLKHPIHFDKYVTNRMFVRAYAAYLIRSMLDSETLGMADARLKSTIPATRWMQFVRFKMDLGERLGLEQVIDLITKQQLADILQPMCNSPLLSVPGVPLPLQTRLQPKGKVEGNSTKSIKDQDAGPNAGSTPGTSGSAKGPSGSSKLFNLPEERMVYSRLDQSVKMNILNRLPTESKLAMMVVDKDSFNLLEEYMAPIRDCVKKNPQIIDAYMLERFCIQLLTATVLESMIENETVKQTLTRLEEICEENSSTKAMEKNLGEFRKDEEGLSVMLGFGKEGIMDWSKEELAEIAKDGPFQSPRPSIPEVPLKLPARLRKTQPPTKEEEENDGKVVVDCDRKKGRFWYSLYPQNPAYDPKIVESDPFCRKRVTDPSIYDNPVYDPELVAEYGFFARWLKVPKGHEEMKLNEDKASKLKNADTDKQVEDAEKNSS